MRDKGFSLGRSCQPLALRNQWLTDVGSAANVIYLNNYIEYLRKQSKE